MSKVNLVKMAMLGVQRQPWEQGVCMQALYELGDETTAFAMAHDAVLRQKPDGRLAAPGPTRAVTDPASNGEAVFRAFEKTGDAYYGDAARRMLDYLMTAAPRTDDGILCHNEVQTVNGRPLKEIWVDSVYMAPPFLAVMGEIREAEKQIRGMTACLRDESTGVLFHRYDAESRRLTRAKRWATGNGWALLGIARVIDEAGKRGEGEIRDGLVKLGVSLLDAMLPYQRSDGRFHDILDEEDSFADGASAMMLAAFVFRGVANGWLSEAYLPRARRVLDVMDEYVDELGVIHEVCGAPDFVRSGTSAESMAAYLMMRAFSEKVLTMNLTI